MSFRKMDLSNDLKECPDCFARGYDHGVYSIFVCEACNGMGRVRAENNFRPSSDEAIDFLINKSLHMDANIREQRDCIDKLRHEMSNLSSKEKV